MRGWRKNSSAPGYLAIINNMLVVLWICRLVSHGFLQWLVVPDKGGVGIKLAVSHIYFAMEVLYPRPPHNVLVRTRHIYPDGLFENKRANFLQLLGNYAIIFADSFADCFISRSGARVLEETRIPRTLYTRLKHPGFPRQDQLFNRYISLSLFTTHVKWNIFEFINNLYSSMITYTIMLLWKDIRYLICISYTLFPAIIWIC